MPAAGDVDTIENGEVDEGGTTGDGASRPTPSSPDTVSEERSEPDRFDDPFRMDIREIGRVEGFMCASIATIGWKSPPSL